MLVVLTLNNASTSTLTNHIVVLQMVAPFDQNLASLWRTNTPAQTVASVRALASFAEYALFLRPSAYDTIAGAVITVLEAEPV